MRSTIFVAASLACFSSVSAGFYPDQTQTVNCGNVDAAIAVEVGNSLNCNVDQANRPSPYPQPVYNPSYNPGYPYNPYNSVPQGQGDESVNCGNTNAAVAVGVGNSIVCNVDQTTPSQYYPQQPQPYYPPYPYFKAKAASEKKKEDHKS